MSWMQPGCEEAARLMSQQRDEPLGRWQRLRLRWHLARCGDCREVERQLARIGALGRDGFLETGPGAGERAQR
jgi:hypothetical protein